MMKPTVHLNGTHRRDLYDLYSDAIHAVQLAVAKVQAGGPNGRDYYPQGPTAIETALEEHRSRLVRLQAVQAELEAIIEHIVKGSF
jgi:hypothetical protein